MVQWEDHHHLLVIDHHPVLAEDQPVLCNRAQPLQPNCIMGHQPLLDRFGKIIFAPNLCEEYNSEIYQLSLPHFFHLFITFFSVQLLDLDTDTVQKQRRELQLLIVELKDRDRYKFNSQTCEHLP